jgi:hypothetical protein
MISAISEGAEGFVRFEIIETCYVSVTINYEMQPSDACAISCRPNSES